MFDHVVEAQNQEAVVTVERVDDPGGRAARRNHLPPRHGPGPVQQDDHVPRRAARRVRRSRRDDRQRPGAGGGFAGVGHDQGGGLRPVPGDVPAHQQVAVQALAGLESQPYRPAGSFHRGRVQRRAQVRDAQPGRVEADNDVEVGTLVGGPVPRRRDPARVRDRVGVMVPPEPRLLAGKRGPCRVPLRDHEREAVGRFAGFEGDRAGELQLHDGIFAGHQVADPGAEHLRPVFLGDGGALSGGHGKVIGLASCCPLLEHSGDAPAAQCRGERGHRRPSGQREHVRDFDGRVGGVGEALPDVGRRGQTDDDGVDLDGAQRQDARARAQHPSARKVFFLDGFGRDWQALQRGHGVLLCFAGSVIDVEQAPFGEGRKKGTGGGDQRRHVRSVKRTGGRQKDEHRPDRHAGEQRAGGVAADLPSAVVPAAAVGRLRRGRGGIGLDTPERAGTCGRHRRRPDRVGRVSGARRHLGRGERRRPGRRSRQRRERRRGRLGYACQLLQPVVAGARQQPANLVQAATCCLQLLDRHHLQEVAAAVVGRAGAAQFQRRIEQALRRVIPQGPLGRTHPPRPVACLAFVAEHRGGCLGEFGERESLDHDSDCNSIQAS